MAYSGAWARAAERRVPVDMPRFTPPPEAYVAVAPTPGPDMDVPPYPDGPIDGHGWPIEMPMVYQGWDDRTWQVTRSPDSARNPGIDDGANVYMSRRKRMQPQDSFSEAVKWQRDPWAANVSHIADETRLRGANTPENHEHTRAEWQTEAGTTYYRERRMYRPERLPGQPMVIADPTARRGELPEIAAISPLLARGRYAHSFTRFVDALKLRDKNHATQELPPNPTSPDVLGDSVTGADWDDMGSVYAIT